MKDSNFKTIKLYKKDSEVIKDLQREYLAKCKKRISMVSIVSKLLAKAELEDITNEEK